MSVSFSRPQIRKRFNGVSRTEIAVIDGVTPGTALASKALVLGASKDIATITSATITTLTSTTANVTTVSATTLNGTTVNAGADASAGTLNVFPTTTAKGKLALTVTDQTGNTTVSLVIGAMAAARTITLQDPGATANLLTSTGVGGTQITRVTAQVDQTGTTLANVTGLSQTVVAGTYAFEIYLPTTCGGTGGVKLAFNYTTTVLSALSAMAYAYTASAIATASTTTTTTQTSIITSATAFTSVVIKGTMVVSTGGTIDLQFAENNANSTSSVLVGGFMKFTRIA